MTPAWMLRWVKAEPHEAVPLRWAFAYFFCLLCGYYMLRPVRDEMAIEGGLHHLPWMMTGTFLTLVAATPVFGWVSGRLSRYRLLLSVYGFFACHLVLFFVAMTAGWHPDWVARVFFVWLSVFNLFVVSVFWSFMADLFTPEQGTRIFGVIAAGGSTGAIVGPLLTAGVTMVGPIALLMVLSVLWLGACCVCIHRLDRWASTQPQRGPSAEGRSLGGGIWAGVQLVGASPYLLGICAYVVMLTMSATVLYVEQTTAVSRAISSPEERTRLFAGIDLVVNLLTCLAQVWVTNRLVLRFGLAAALMCLPAVSAVGFLALGMSQVLPLFIGFTVLRRVGEYAIAKPAREVLFTVVSREEKYKAKNVIDTAVSRGGDASTGWAVSGLKAVGATTAHLAWLMVPIMVVWAWVGWALARREAQVQRKPVVQA